MHFCIFVFVVGWNLTIWIFTSRYVFAFFVYHFQLCSFYPLSCKSQNNRILSEMSVYSCNKKTILKSQKKGLRNVTSFDSLKVGAENTKKVQKKNILKNCHKPYFPCRHPSTRAVILLIFLRPFVLNILIWTQLLVCTFCFSCLEGSTNHA